MVVLITFYQLCDCNFPAGIFLFKVNNGNIRTTYEICSMLPIKTTDDVNNLDHANAGWIINNTSRYLE